MLVLVHLLPTQPMKEHVYHSLDMIEKEFADEVMIDGFKATLTGNFTDCLMLEHAVYTSSEHSLLEQVLHMYRGESYAGDGWQPGHSLEDYIEGLPQPREEEYSRYWHGYLVILKPLLLLTSFNAIRLLNSSIQLIVIGYVLIGFCKKKYSPLAKAFLVSLPFLFFVSTYASLSLSIIFYIMTLSLLIQLKTDDFLYRKDLYGEFFLIVGMATTYFDFLTYPLVTLAYPLCLYLYLHGKNTFHDIRQLVKNSLEWCIGYIGLWAAKWVISDLLTGSSTIRDAMETVLYRTGNAAERSRISGFFYVTAKNMQVYSNWCFALLLAALLFVLLVRAWKSGWRKLLNNLSKGVPCFIVALYPFIWYFVIQNHSEQHWQFTCRILAISVFAITAGFQKILSENE